MSHPPSPPSSSPLRGGAMEANPSIAKRQPAVLSIDTRIGSIPSILPTPQSPSDASPTTPTPVGKGKSYEIAPTGRLTPPLTPTKPKISKRPEPKSIEGEYTVSHGARYGEGAWSTVHPGSILLPGKVRPVRIAVKVARNATSKQYLRSEAEILSFLPAHENIMPFYGYDSETGRLLLEALPRTLEEFVDSSRREITSEANFSNLTSRIPVVGMRQWLYLSSTLLSALSHLKAHGVVHADIKPSNILLREFTPRADSFWGPEPLVAPILADFSSAFIAGEDPQNTTEVALTTTFCAPELLTTANNAPTFSSDLFATAMTLLIAAIGSNPYGSSAHPGSEGLQLLWCKEGDPMSFARADERGLRVRRGGVVDRVLERCFGKEARRVGVEEVSGRVSASVEEWGENRGKKLWGC